VRCLPAARDRLAETSHGRGIARNHDDDAHAHAVHAAHVEGHHHSEHKYDGVAPAHESPWVMLVPLIILAFGAIFAGFIFNDAFVGEGSHEFWGHAIYTSPENHILHERHNVPEWVKYMPLIVTLLGLLGAMIVYLWNKGLGEKIAKATGPIHAFLYNKWYFDELYDAVFVKGARALGDFFWKVGDQKIIDGLGPNGIANDINFLSKKSVKVQSGYVYHYAFIMLIALVAFGALVLLKKG
jgi:NADH-quinone oxidoreductase subunit L